MRRLLTGSLTSFPASSAEVDGWVPSTWWGILGMILVLGTLGSGLSGAEFQSQKKGFGYWGNKDNPAGNLAAPKNEVRARWCYNWSERPWATIPAGTEYVPMIIDGTQISYCDSIKALNPGVKTLLGFNEPDSSAMGNMTVDEAIRLWPKLMDTGLRLGSPAPAKPGYDPTSWLGQFMAKANSLNYRVDFICVHKYADKFNTTTSVRQLKDYLEKIHQAYGKPIWLTEFAMANYDIAPTQEQVDTYINAAIPMLEDLDYVERYAWFGMGEHQVRADGTQDGLITSDLCDHNGNISATGRTYRDSHPASRLSFKSLAFSAPEGASGTTTCTITVARLGVTLGPVSVQYATADGTATTADGDYVATNGTLSWAAGDSADKTFNVTIKGDLKAELHETLRLTLSNPTGWALLDTPWNPATDPDHSQATLTIRDDDTAAVPVIQTASALAGGLVGVPYPDTVLAATPVAFTWRLASGTMPKGMTLGADTGRISGTPENSGTFTFAVIAGNSVGDSAPQTFTMTVRFVGTLAFSRAVFSKAEGDSGTSTASIIVTRSGGSGGPVAVDYRVSDGTATGDVDYTPKTGTLNWADGDASYKSFTVTIAGDTVPEIDETVNLTLSAPTNGAKLGAQSTAQLTILNDDAVPVIATVDLPKALVGAPYQASLSASGVPTAWTLASGSLPPGLSLVSRTGTISGTATAAGIFTFSLMASNAVGGSAPVTLSLVVDAPGVLAFTRTDFSTAEGNGGTTTATITVGRSGGSAGLVAVDWRTGDGTAVPESDYTPASGTLTWPDGDASDKQFVVAIAGDLASEPDETVLLTLAAPTNGAKLGPASSARLTILNDDDVPDIAAATLPGAILGVPYQVGLTASGAPTAWVVDGGALPAGVVLESATGTLRGIPTTPSATMFTVVARNAAGTSSPRSFQLTVTTDTTPPAVPVLNATTSTGTARPILSGSAEPGAAIIVRDGRGDEVARTTADPGTGAWTTTTAMIPPGTQELSIRAVDASGNQSDRATFTAQVPPLPRLRFSAADYPAAMPRSGTATVLVSVERLDNGEGTPSVAYATGDGTALADRDYRTTSGVFAWTEGSMASQTFAVTILGGRINGPSATIRLTLASPGGATLDVAEATITIAPFFLPVPAITTVATLPDGAVGVPYALALQAVGEVSSWRLAGGRLPAGLTLDGGEGRISGTPTGGETVTCSVIASNAAGDSAARSLTLTITAPDTTPPEAPILGSYASSGTATPMVEGSSEPYATIVIRLPGRDGELTRVAASDLGRWSVTLAALPAGTHDLQVTAQDAAGNTSPITHFSAQVPEATPRSGGDGGAPDGGGGGGGCGMGSGVAVWLWGCSLWFLRRSRRQPR